VWLATQQRTRRERGAAGGDRQGRRRVRRLASRAAQASRRRYDSEGAQPRTLDVGRGGLRQPYRAALAGRYGHAARLHPRPYRLALVPWKPNRGYAKVRLGADIGGGPGVGLGAAGAHHGRGKVASQRVSEANGGPRAGEVINPRFGSGPKLLFSSAWRRCQHRQPTCGKTG
jgi:hypothetical protein